MKPIEKCPICHSRLPLYRHILFNAFVGEDCPTCGSILIQEKKNNLILYGLLIISVVLIVKFSVSLVSDKPTEWLYLVLWVIVFCVSIYLKLTGKFISLTNRTKQLKAIKGDVTIIKRTV